jgi:hypothetical protein
LLAEIDKTSKQLSGCDFLGFFGVLVNTTLDEFAIMSVEIRALQVFFHVFLVNRLLFVSIK